MFKDLLRERLDEIQTTQRVLEESIASKNYNQEVMVHLHQVTNGKIRVTARMVEAAVANEERGEQIMNLLLEERGD